MVTYDDVANFYKDKENVVNYEPQHDACNRLAKAFFYGCGALDDCIYSQEIKKRMIEGTLTKLATFNYFKEEEAFELVLSGFVPIKQGNRMVINPSQKWHLYVSYLAYQEIREKLNFPSKVIKVSGEKFVEQSFDFEKKVKQGEYIKWMKKVAGLDEDSSWKGVEESIENLRN